MSSRRSVTSLALAVALAIPSARAGEAAPAAVKAPTLMEPPSGPRPGATEVEGGGSPRAPSAGEAEHGVVASIGWTTWIRAEPRLGARKVGHLRPGQIAQLRGPDLVGAPGCPRGFVPVSPAGWVCGDVTVTDDPTDERVRRAAASLPSDDVLPYRYGLSSGAPRYGGWPTEDEQSRVERPLGPAGRHPPLPSFWAARAPLLESPTPPSLDGAGVTPAWVALFERSARAPRPREDAPFGAGLAWSAEVVRDDRRWLLASDGVLIPADRVRPLRPVRFAGAAVAAADLATLGWTARGAARWMETADGPRATAFHFAPRERLTLTGRSVDGPDGRLLEVTAAPGVDARLVRERDVSRPSVPERLPFGVGPGERWLQIDLSEGVLVAFEGLEPRFATLVSVGRGGQPRSGGDPVADSTTPLGVFRVTYKHRSSTMTSSGAPDHSLAEVPWVQYFHAPFALHGVYWHEALGQPMSGGCVNLSPADARWLFDFTAPTVPSSWAGAAAEPALGGGTAVVVRR